MGKARPVGVVVDVAGDGRQRGAEVGRCLGLVGGGERDEEPVVDLDVEDGDAYAVGGEHVAVGVREPADQAVQAEPRETANCTTPYLEGLISLTWADIKEDRIDPPGQNANWVSDRTLPPGSANQATWSPPGVVQTPLSSWSIPA